METFSQSLIYPHSDLYCSSSLESLPTLSSNKNHQNLPLFFSAAMAMNFSPSTPTPVGSVYQHKPKCLLSLQPKDSQTPRLKTSSWGAVSNYVKLKIRVRDFAAKSPFVKRQGVFRCATIEEIEAEKSFIEEDVKERMEKTIDTVRSNFNSIRTGRSNPAMLDKIEVEYYGAPTNLKSLAQISTPDASSLLVKPYDKSVLKAIEKAIVTSDLGMTPNNDGEVIRLTLPQLTSERRKELAKLVAKQAEEGKVALRNIRRDAIKSYEKLEKEKKLSEDNVKDLSSDLQKVTDEYMKKIDLLYKQKEKELLTV